MIEAARDRQRRRRRAVAAIACGVVAASALPGALNVRYPRLFTSTSSTLEVAPGDVLSRAPTMGIACRLPDAVACDRIGLAVWLRDPAASVTATIDGRLFKLDSAASSARPIHDKRTMFAGFLRTSGLVNELPVIRGRGPVRWYGQDGPSPLVTLRINYGTGRPVLTRPYVLLSSRWHDPKKG